MPGGHYDGQADDAAGLASGEDQDGARAEGRDLLLRPRVYVAMQRRAQLLPRVGPLVEIEALDGALDIATPVMEAEPQ